MSTRNKKPLQRLFGGNRAKMLDFLITMREFEYTLDEITEKCGIPNKRYARSTFRSLFGDGFIIVSKTNGNGQYLYRLNTHKTDGLVKYFDQCVEDIKMSMEYT